MDSGGFIVVLFCLFVFGSRISCNPSLQICYVAEVGLELLIILPSSPSARIMGVYHYASLDLSLFAFVLC